MKVPAANLTQQPVGDWSSTQWGGTFLPLQPDLGQPVANWWEYGALLRDADPARFYVLDFFIWAINFFVGQRLAAEAKASAAPIQQGVTGVSTVDPEAFFQTRSTEFLYPLLAVYRVSSTANYKTMVLAHRTGAWQFRYILPALSYEQAQRIEPIFSAVEDAVDAATENGFHPQYAPPGGKLGDSPWQRAGFEEIDTEDSSWAHWPHATTGGLVHLAYTLNLKVIVRRMQVERPLPGAPVPFLGADVDAQIATPPASPALPVVIDGVATGRAELSTPTD